MSKRLDEIQARLDAADADLRAQNAWVDFTDHAHDDIAYLLERVRMWKALADLCEAHLSAWGVDVECGEKCDG